MAKSKYAYDKSLEGCTIWSRSKIVLNDKTTQKQLEELHKLGVKGITKTSSEE